MPPSLLSARRPLRLLLAGALLLVLASCDRPFLDSSGPEIEVVAPDLSTILTRPTAMLQLSVESFSEINRVEVNGRSLTFNPNNELWEDTLRFSRGINPLRIAAFDRQGNTTEDTLFAVYLPFEVQRHPASLPEARGGHTTTLLNDGSLLVTGGTSASGSAARDDAFLLRPGALEFTRLQRTLNVARTGHTATLLPDGHVLILGGAATDAPDGVGDLVEGVEVFDPETQTFQVVPFEGEPIRRAFHTAVLHVTSGDLFIDLYGGLGDVQYGSSPRFGTRGDLRRFRLRSEQFTEMSPAPIGIFPTGEAIAGHSQTLLQTFVPTGSTARYLVAGQTAGDGPASFRMLFHPSQGISTEDTEPMPEPRTRHAAVLLEPGMVIVAGGTEGDAADARAEPLLYLESADRYFRFPPDVALVKRFGHTATKYTGQRILIVGGYSTSGNAVSVSELLIVDLL